MIEINNMDLLNDTMDMSVTRLLAKRKSGTSCLSKTYKQDVDLLKNDNSQETTNSNVLGSRIKPDESKSQISDIPEVILNKLLEQIQPVRFTELAGLKDGQTIKQKHQIVLVVRQVMEIADLNNSGFMVDDNQVYVYTGSFWSFVSEDILRKFLGEAAAKLGVNSLDAELYTYREELLKQLVEIIPKPPKKDSSKILINLVNGTLCVSGKGEIKVEPFQKKDYLKYQLDYKYDEHAKCPLFQTFINRIMPDINTQQVLKQFVGSIFIKDTNYQKTLWLVGKGRNGKSTFLNILTELIGKTNITNYSPEQLTQSSSYERGEISGKLLNLSDEMGGKIGIPLFKSMVCGEPVPARRIWDKPFTMYDYPKMVASINRLPKRIETTEAFYRRLLIVPFDNPIKKEELNYNIAQEIIEKELSGVLVWVIAGVKELIEQKGFTESALVEEAVRVYRLDTDNIASFVDEEGYILDRTNRIPLKELYPTYVQYCKARGFNQYDYNDFSSKLKDMGFEYKREPSGYSVLINKRN